MKTYPTVHLTSERTSLNTIADHFGLFLLSHLPFVSYHLIDSISLNGVEASLKRRLNSWIL